MAATKTRLLGAEKQDSQRTQRRLSALPATAGRGQTLQNPPHPVSTALALETAVTRPLGQRELLFVQDPRGWEAPSPSSRRGVAEGSPPQGRRPRSRQVTPLGAAERGELRPTHKEASPQAGRGERTSGEAPRKIPLTPRLDSTRSGGVGGSSGGPPGGGAPARRGPRLPFCSVSRAARPPRQLRRGAALARSV